MERNTAFLLKQPVVCIKTNEQSLKEEIHLKQMRERYKNKILQSRRSHNSLSRKKSIEQKINKYNTGQGDLPRTRHASSKNFLSISKVIRDLKLVSPDPKDKFYQYLLITPSNRSNQNINILTFYLQHYKFMKCHPTQLHELLAMNMMLKQGNVCEEDDIVIVENPTRTHKKFQEKGVVIKKEDIVPKQQYICINKTKYKEIIESYFGEHFEDLFQNISRLQLFRNVERQLLYKVLRSGELVYKLKGQILYGVEDQPDRIFVVMKGKISRKVIIQIQKNNILPSTKGQILTNNAVYEVGIEFTEGDVLGYLQLLQQQQLSNRCETTYVIEDCTVFSLKYQALKQLKPGNLKWFKKEKAHKYPKNYQQLCNQYDSKISFNKKVKLMARASLKQQKQGNLILQNYRINNIKYVRSYSMYRPRKSIY